LRLNQNHVQSEDDLMLHKGNVIPCVIFITRVLARNWIRFC